MVIHPFPEGTRIIINVEDVYTHEGVVHAILPTHYDDFDKEGWYLIYVTDSDELELWEALPKYISLAEG